jgi:hypothetical protein
MTLSLPPSKNDDFFGLNWDKNRKRKMGFIWFSGSSINKNKYLESCEIGGFIYLL